MPQSPCSNMYFPAGNAKLLEGGTQIGIIVNKAAGKKGIASLQVNPFVPIAGMKFDGASNTYQYLTVASNKANAGLTIIALFNACLNASINYATDNLVAPDQILFGDKNYFAGYLNKITQGGVGLAFQHYLYIANVIYNFWLNANAAWTTDVYFEQIQKLKTYIQQIIDPTFFIAPADYDFAAASVAAIQIAAWEVADVNLAAIEVLELAMSQNVATATP